MSAAKANRSISVRTRLVAVAALCALLAAVPTSQLALRYATELDQAAHERAALPVSLAWSRLVTAVQQHRLCAMTMSQPDAEAQAAAAAARVDQAFAEAARALAQADAPAARREGVGALQHEFAALKAAAAKKPFPPTAVLPQYREFVGHVLDEAHAIEAEAGLWFDPDAGTSLVMAASLQAAPQVRDALSELSAIARAVAVDDIAAVSGAASRYRTHAVALGFDLAQAAQADAASRAELDALGRRFAAQRQAVEQMLAAAAADVNYPLDKLSRTLEEASAQQERVSQDLLASAEKRVEARAARLRLRALAVLALVVAGLAATGLVLWRTVRGILQPVLQAVEVTERIANGDLSCTVPPSRGDEIGRVLAAIAAMQHALRGMVEQLHGSSTQITSAAAEIAAGNASLSQRTERTASGLQRTTGEMARIGAAAREGTDAAHEATRLAGDARAAAERGGDVVNAVVSTMRGIHGSSHRIAEITGVIDGIAFQTNILALNAAVEAARAGQHGRGFAVVASEVRSLAQRSAEAAREIKTLIGASVEEIDAGSRLAGDAGAAMSDIVERIARVTQAMDTVAEAATHQAGGLERVQNAVAGIDTITQQNSALVQESAAAAEAMREEAHRMHALVGRFRLDAAA
jgi:methyl-accepting chemotaxis protein